jgi:hypothetical protein
MAIARRMDAGGRPPAPGSPRTVGARQGRRRSRSGRARLPRRRLPLSELPRVEPRPLARRRARRSRPRLARRGALHLRPLRAPPRTSADHHRCPDAPCRRIRDGHPARRRRSGGGGLLRRRASSQGDVNEAMVFASSFTARRLRLLQQPVGDLRTGHGAVALPDRGSRPGFGIPSMRVDGNDVLACTAAMRWALDHARRGEVPCSSRP